MKKILILMATYYLCSSAIGQETVFDLAAKATYLETSEMDNFKRIIDLDVLEYFGLQDINTELEIATFKKTEEYNQKLEELKREKKKLLTTNYYIPYYVVSKDMAYHGVPVSTDYDMKKKGVSIKIGPAIKYLKDMRTPKLIGGTSGEFIFRALPTEWKSDGSVGGLQREYLFLPVSEKLGLEVEAARDEGELGVHYYFTIDGKQTVDGIAYLKADKVRVVLANIISGKIYSDKVYTYKTSTAKKTNVKK